MPQIPIMTTAIKIKQGLDIKLKGEAERSVEIVSSGLFAIQPTDFVGVLPRLLVQEGDIVEVGTPLFQDKHDERILFTSPVKGTVKEIRRGEKRLLQAVVVESSNETTEILPIETLHATSLQREAIIQKMLETGLWPMIRQRPYSVIANPDTMPKAFFVSGFDTHPLAPDLDFIVEHFPDSFQKGLEILSILSGKKVHLCVHAEKTVSEVLLKAKTLRFIRLAVLTLRETSARKSIKSALLIKVNWFGTARCRMLSTLGIISARANSISAGFMQWLVPD